MFYVGELDINVDNSTPGIADGGLAIHLCPKSGVTARRYRPKYGTGNRAGGRHDLYYLRENDFRHRMPSFVVRREQRSSCANNFPHCVWKCQLYRAPHG